MTSGALKDHRASQKEERDAGAALLAVPLSAVSAMPNV